MTDNDRDDASERPAEVEQKIGRTRVEIATTLNAIESKLNARYLVEKGLEMFKESFTGGDAVNRGMSAVRNNPVPVALIGIGAAWLIASNTGVADRIAQDERLAAARRRVGDLASDIGNRAGSLASDVAGRVGIGGATGSADQPLGHTGNPMVDRPAGAQSDGWVHQVSGFAQGALRSVRDSGGAVINQAGDGAGRIAGQVTGAIERHPLLIGAIGAMAGALIASVVPLTQTEEEWIGSTRKQFWNRAEEVGEEAVSRVRDAASRAASRAVDAATAAATETIKAEIKEELGQAGSR